MGLRRHLLFMCGQLGIMLQARFFFQWLVDFCSQGEVVTEALPTRTLFSAGLVGVVLLGFRVFDGVTDPVAGSLSDRWVRKGKERRVLLWYTAPLPALGLTLCFAPSFAQGEMVRWAFLLGGMLTFFVGYTLYAIPYWSLIGDYAQEDEAQRGTLSNLLGVGLLLATAVGFLLTPMMIEAWGYLYAAETIALVSIPLMIAPYFAMPDGIEAVQSISQSNLSRTWQDELKDLISALQYRRFASTICLFAGSQMSFTVMTAAAPFIAVDLLSGNKGDVALILGPLLGVALPSTLIVPWLSRRFGWEKCITGACFMLGIVYMGTVGLGGSLVGSPLLTASLLFALGGPMVAVLLGLEGAAITSCAADSEGGVGMFFGAYNLMVKGCNGVAIALTSILAERARAGDLFSVKLMGMSAGAMLLTGVVGYLVLRPPRESKI